MSNGLARFRGGYSYPAYRYPYGAPALLERQRLEANRKRWRALSRAVGTRGDAAKCTTTVVSAWDRSFRLVDTHGQCYGRRYGYFGCFRCDERTGRREFLVSSAQGDSIWLDQYTRIRIVDAQPEDLHSRFSRMLKAEFKRG
jgi:hypothetical protein